jgi:hypothetical protein
MRDHEKPRGAASELLITLRKAMGKTQQTFAVEVLKTAIGTVARYETSDPPQGELLLRLQEIADEHGLPRIGFQFELLYRKEMQKKLSAPLVVFDIDSPTREKEGHLSLLLRGNNAIRAAYNLILLMGDLDNSDPKYRQNAIAAIDQLEDAVLDARAAKEEDLLKRHDPAMSAPKPQPSAKKTSRRK